MKKEVWYENGKRRSTPEYRSWQMMKNRCHNPRACDYRYYGGRGITVCAKWKKDFYGFLVDMGRRPSNAHTLDRKNTDKNYTKNNCQWATRQQQAQNRNYNVISLKKAKQIRILYASGYGDQNKIAKKFKTNQATISQITRGFSWKNAGGPLSWRSQKYRR